MSRTRRFCWLLPAWIPLAVLAVGCSSPAPVAGAPPHFATRTVTATVAGLQPESRVVIPAFGTVVFKNGLPQGDVVVRVARRLQQSENCATTLAFREEGDSTVSQPIPPQAVTALCFHAPGRFAFTMKGPSGEQSGTIEVEGGR